MSTDVRNIRHVRIFEPRSKINPPRNIAVVSGPSEVTYFTDVSTSYSSSSVSHSLNIPSNSILDSRVYVKWVLQFTFAGTVGSGNLLQIGTNDAVRSFPISEIVTATNATINGQTTSFSNMDMISALQHFIGTNDERMLLSGAAPYDDQFQQYADYVTYGSNRNALGQYGNATMGNVEPRGSLVYNVLSNTSTAAVVQVSVIEPLFVSPFTWGKMQTRGLAGLTQVNLQFLIGDMTRAWSHAAASNAGTFSSLSVSLSQPPEIHFCVLTPNRLSNPYSIFHRYEYPYYNLPFQSFVGPSALASGAQVQTTTGVVQCNSIPSRFYIFARQQNSDRSYLTSDTFAEINKLSITWNNKSNLLSGAHEDQIYSLSSQHGSNQSWSQWQMYQGSVACVEMGTDIGLNEDESVGMVGKYQLQAFMTITNRSSGPVNYSLYVIPVYPGIFFLEGNQASISTALVSKEEVLTAQNSDISWYDRDLSEPFGGSFFGPLWSGIKEGLSNAIDKVGVPLARIGVTKGIEKLKDKIGLGEHYSAKQSRSQMLKKIM